MVTFNANKQGLIEKVDFEAQEVISSFSGAPSWEGVPNFAIITGRNGIGKTKLLDTISSKSSFRRELYVKDTFQFGKPEAVSTMEDNRLPYWSHNEEMIFDELVKFAPTAEAKAGKLTTQENYYSLLLKKISSELKIEISNRNFTLDEAKKNQIKEIITATPDYYSMFSNFDNLSVYWLARLFEMYADYINRITNKYFDEKRYLELLEYYKEQEGTTKSEPIIMSEFKNLYSDELQLKGFIAKFFQAKNKLKAPWEEINTVLEKHGFPYTVIYRPLEKRKKPQNKDTTHFAEIFNKDILFMKREGGFIKADHLSSGEKMILNLLCWAFFTEFIARPEILGDMPPKPRLMLLDEPDQHLDPRLAKTFMSILSEEISRKHYIQVIMTTHRIDTISLAPKDSIFTMHLADDDKIRISRCTQMHAIMRMTSNINELTNMHTRVYVESFDDASFYNAAYNHLRAHSDRMHEKARKPYTWLDKIALADNRLLSRRYTLEFFSVATQNGGGGGGYQEVHRAIMRDILAVDKQKFFRNKIDKYHLDKSAFEAFGIIDGDVPNLNSESIQKNIVRLEKRYCLENFLYDPLIVMQSLDPDDIEKIQDKGMREICTNIRTMLENSDFSSDACLKYQERWLNYIQEKVNAQKLGTQFVEKALKRLNNNKHPQELDNANNLKEDWYKTWGTININVIRFNSDKQSSSQVFKLPYYKVFLDIRGHNLEYVEKGKGDGKKGRDNSTENQIRFLEPLFFNGFKQKIINGFSSLAGSIYLPADLVEVITDLNSKIRAHMTPVIKPSWAASQKRATDGLKEGGPSKRVRE